MKEWEKNLQEVNEEVAVFGYKVIIEQQKDDAYFDCIVERDGVKVKDVYAQNYYESELEELIADVRLHIIKEATKVVFIVSYISLCAEEEDANGYNEVSAFNTYAKAQEHLRSLRDNEIDFLKDEEREYDVEIDTEDVFCVSWNDKASSVHIRIHKLNIK